MVMTDPIADMLTRIRNAASALHNSVDVPASNMKKAIAELLLQEGYIKGFEVLDNNNQGTIRIALKYGPNRTQVIHGIKRISKPGLRIYSRKNEIPRVLGGLGIALISTSQGLVTDNKARELRLGGEVVCYVW
ncbi:30S ribosomal protein S8 [Clostridium sp. 'deep sea']|jgi:small subunit ribosomal protein S8|uniref:30S ribosomal protein S8 n=1 Tax=Clostridium sp. 'deep sea' TaxID=2779445 RepID=UPI0018964349|nr:30S ribosomal protein S8 [Clostridium sp. 'deep sea']QOR34591.1 30S ribosomal protein S8 [Clostridium sp. 'deep sea']